MLRTRYDKGKHAVVVSDSDKIIAELGGEDFLDFEFEFKKAAKIMIVEQKIKLGKYRQLTLGDLSEACRSIDALGGIEIWLDWLYLVESMYGAVKVVSKEGKKRRLREAPILTGNFECWQAAGEGASSLEIRRCFDEAFIREIEKRPDFKVWVNGNEVPRDFLLSDRREMFFKFARNSDT